MKPILTKFVLAGIILVFTLPSCTKYKILNPNPPIQVVLREQFPMSGYIDSLEALNPDSFVLFIGTAGLFAPDTKEFDSANGQAEMGYAFRTSSPGVVFSLGIYVPYGGYDHTVTLWDSATGAVLAQTNVHNSSGAWAFAGLGGSPAFLQANHGYIMGFNTNAVGVPLGTANPGNLVYTIQGLYDFETSGEVFELPILPFTYKSVTVEGWYWENYTTPITQPIFPVPAGLMNYQVNSFFGACDIGFLPE